MKQPFFNDHGNIRNLLEAANRWLGTPWSANGMAIGDHGGVSCHNLPRMLYIEAGALPVDFPKPLGDPNGTRHGKDSAIAAWLDSRPEFMPLPEGATAMPGDLVGLRIYNCVDHLGVRLLFGEFIHVLMHKKTDIDMLHVPPWQQRALRFWRPLAQ